MTSDNPHQDAHTALDEAARSAHAASLDRLSPRVQAQLAVRRRAALTQNTRTTGARAWPVLALGSAAALTLAVGLFVLRGNGPVDLPKTPDTVVTVVTVVTVPATDPVPAADAAAGATMPMVAQDPAAEKPDVVVDAGAGNAASNIDIDIDAVVIEDDALPAELLAAGFDTANETFGFDRFEENPDFYLWLSSEEAQTDLQELL